MPISANTELTPTEIKLVALLRGPKLSDKKTRAALGLTQEQSIRLHHELRTKLGVTKPGASLRDFVRKELALH
jgi:hypothetical protein